MGFPGSECWFGGGYQSSILSPLHVLFAYVGPFFLDEWENGSWLGERRRPRHERVFLRFDVCGVTA